VASGVQVAFFAVAFVPLHLLLRSLKQPPDCHQCPCYLTPRHFV